MRSVIFTSLILILCCAMTGAVFAIAPVTDGLVLQLDASAITGLSDGDQLTVWPASIGSDAVAAGPTPVIYKTNVINGLPVVRFDGNGGYVHFDKITDIRTIFWVVEEDADVNNAGDGQFRHLLSDNSAYDFHRAPLTQTGGSYCAMVSSQWANTAVQNAATAINGSSVNPLETPVPHTLSIISMVTTGDVTASRFSYDRSQSVLRSWDGDLAELLIYNRALTAEELQTVGRYLAHKYGLTTSYLIYNPAQAVNPADGAIDVAKNTTLQWSSVSGATEYDVYLGKSLDNMTKVSTTTGTTYPATLDGDSTYYWQVKTLTGPATDPNNVNLGPVWTFNTVKTLPVFDPPYGQQPEPFTAEMAGNSVTLTAVAGVSPGEDANITYQWTQNGHAIAGATSSTLTLDPLADSDAGKYVCQATNSNGTTESQTAVVKVIKLLSHWPLDGNLNDVIAGRNGSIPEENVVPLVYDTGIDGQAIHFDGLGDMAAMLPTSALSDPNDYSFTLMFWEHTDADAPGNAGYMMASGAGAGYEKLYMWRWHNPSYNCDYYGNLDVGQGGTIGPVHNAGDFPFGMWHQQALTYDSITRKVTWYVDGQARASGTLPNPFTGFDTVFFVGNRRNLARPFHGMIDDVRLYNHPLPPEMIARKYYDMTGNTVCLQYPTYDINHDCRVDLQDFALLASEWFECNLVPSSACN